MTDLISDTPGAIAFLEKMFPAGPWNLTCIKPDEKPSYPQGVSFMPEQRAACAEWIDKQQGKRNVYFQLNTLTKPLGSVVGKDDKGREQRLNKAHKDEVKALTHLHVDLDPRAYVSSTNASDEQIAKEAQEYLVAERSRILRMLSSFSPPPTVIIFSGGGYQALWKLQEDSRLEVNGDVQKCEDLEAYNRQIERTMQADNCHNIDRILRLPGTINVPDARKRKKGRRMELATVIEFDATRVYPLDLFVPAVRVQQEVTSIIGRKPSRMRVSGNVTSIGVEELQHWCADNKKTISDHCYALIATATDPLDPGKYPSRSEALFKVCCDLVRAEVPDEMIFAVITGNNDIAISVREKPNWEAYAMRQIERAHEEAEEPWLRMLNEKHCVISDVGGKVRVVSETHDFSLDRSQLAVQTFDDFKARYSNILVPTGNDKKGKPAFIDAGTYWLRHPKRNQRDSVCFLPNVENDAVYNLWRGYGCDALPGNDHEPFLEHILKNICRNNKEYYDYLIKWMARCVQQPATQGEVAVIIRGKKGTGKSFFIKNFGRLFGRHYLYITNANHLVGQFNAHLRDTVLLYADEAFYAGDKKHEAVLKGLVTEDTLMVELKGVDARQARSYVHIMMASNENWVVPAGEDERRYFVLDAGEDHKQDMTFFGSMQSLLDKTGRHHLLYYLMHLNLDGFQVRKAPITEALNDQKMLSLSPERQWWLGKLVDGRILPTHTKWVQTVSKEEMYEDYIQDMHNQGRGYRMSRPALTKFLGEMCPPGYPYDTYSNITRMRDEGGYQTKVTGRYPCYTFPLLKSCREKWDKICAGTAWHEDEAEQTEQEKQGDVF